MLAISEKFPAKIFLFGEYTVLLGGSALLFPYDKFSGQLVLKKERNVQEEKSHQKIYTFFKWLQEKKYSFFSLEQMSLDLQQGLYFSSTIPEGCGLGSSGALCAALYSCYGELNLEIEFLRKNLSLLEEFFHGESSGLDPLVILKNKGIGKKGSEIFLLEEKYTQFFLEHFALLSVPQQNKQNVQNLVKKFKLKLDSEVFSSQIREDLCLQVEKAIEAFLIFDQQELFYSFQNIERIQRIIFTELFLPELSFGKLCGAGGRGYFITIKITK